MRLIMLVEDTPEELPMGVYDSVADMAAQTRKEPSAIYKAIKKNIGVRFNGKKARIVFVEGSGEPPE
jgi:hypothetical protein